MFLEHNMFALLAAVADQDLEHPPPHLLKEVGGGRFCFTCFAGFSSFVISSFFTPQKRGGGPLPYIRHWAVPSVWL